MSNAPRSLCFLPEQKPKSLIDTYFPIHENHKISHPIAKKTTPNTKPKAKPAKVTRSLCFLPEQKPKSQIEKLFPTHEKYLKFKPAVKKDTTIDLLSSAKKYTENMPAIKKVAPPAKPKARSSKAVRSLCLLPAEKPKSLIDTYFPISKKLLKKRSISKSTVETKASVPNQGPFRSALRNKMQLSGSSGSYSYVKSFLAGGIQELSDKVFSRSKSPDTSPNMMTQIQNFTTSADSAAIGRLGADCFFRKKICPTGLATDMLVGGLQSIAKDHPVVKSMLPNNKNKFNGKDLAKSVLTPAVTTLVVMAPVLACTGVGLPVAGALLAEAAITNAAFGGDEYVSLHSREIKDMIFKP